MTSWVRWAVVVPAALLAASCSGIGGGGGSSGGSSMSLTERMSSTMFGAPAKPGEGAREPDNIECPPIDVRQGASTIIVYGPGEQAATNVRWQATVAQTARECALMAATLTIKVGLQGRIVVGPVGGPGRLDVPVRLALVREGPVPMTIWTKLYRVPVDIPAGQTNVPFIHVEDNLTVPKPTGDDMDAYVIYAGFDQIGAKEAPKPRGRRARGRSADAGGAPQRR